MKSKPLSELNIYVIDDDPIFMKIMTQFLEGVKVKIQAQIPFVFFYLDNTADFFDRAKSNEPGIVVLDYRLENDDDAEVSGLEILEEVKAFNNQLRVISYTGDASTVLKNKLLFGGADHFLQKGAKSLKEFEKVLIDEITALTK